MTKIQYNIMLYKSLSSEDYFSIQILVNNCHRMRRLKKNVINVTSFLHKLHLPFHPFSITWFTILTSGAGVQSQVTSSPQGTHRVKQPSTHIYTNRMFSRSQTCKLLTEGSQVNGSSPQLSCAPFCTFSLVGE